MSSQNGCTCADKATAPIIAAGCLKITALLIAKGLESSTLDAYFIVKHPVNPHALEKVLYYVPACFLSPTPVMSLIQSVW